MSRTVREYRPNLGISIRSLVVDAWLLISWASVAFLRSLGARVLYIFGRNYLASRTRTGRLTGDPTGDKPCAWPFGIVGSDESLTGHTCYFPCVSWLLESFLSARVQAWIVTNCLNPLRPHHH